MMESMLTGVVGALLMFGVLVVIHEFGHFVVARWFGVGTPVFSVGMGPRIFGFRFWQTDFRISILPIGGYVRMAGADPFDDDADEAADDEHFMRKPVWQRLLIMLAGPAANLALPVVLFTAVLMLGEPQRDTTIGSVYVGTPAEQAGFRVGDRLLEVDGQPVQAWADAVGVLVDLPPDDAFAVRVQRGEATLDLQLPAGSLFYTPTGLLDLERTGVAHTVRRSLVGVTDVSSPAFQAGIRPGDHVLSVDGEQVASWPELTERLRQGREHALSVARRGADGKVEVLDVPMVQPHAGRPTTPEGWGLEPASLVVGEVLADSAAEAAGVLAGDRLFSIDGEPIRAWSDVLQLVARTVEVAEEGAEARPLSLVVLREGQRVALQFEPTLQREVIRGKVQYRPIMGVRQPAGLHAAGPTVREFYPMTLAFPRALRESQAVLVSIFDVLGGLFTGELAPEESIGGPVEILRAAGTSAQDGLFTFARMMGMISFSLGIINLLPIPALDGGQIVLLALEALRGRPLPLVLRERIQMIGVLALAAVLVMVTVMDVSRWLGG